MTTERAESPQVVTFADFGAFVIAACFVVAVFVAPYICAWHYLDAHLPPSNPTTTSTGRKAGPTSSPGTAERPDSPLNAGRALGVTDRRDGRLEDCLPCNSPGPRQPRCSGSSLQGEREASDGGQGRKPPLVLPTMKPAKVDTCARWGESERLSRPELRASYHPLGALAPLEIPDKMPAGGSSDGVRRLPGSLDAIKAGRGLAFRDGAAWTDTQRLASIRREPGASAGDDRRSLGSPFAQTGHHLQTLAGAAALYEVTAYSHGCILPRNGKEGHARRAANGRWPVADVTVAADTSIHPFGTELLIEGLGFRSVGDRGHVIKGHRLDLFVDTCREAIAFGRRMMRVHLVPSETTRTALR